MPDTRAPQISDVFVHFAVQQDGEARTETLMGKEYLVFPAVLVRAQVLNNNLGRTFLPAEEINDWWASAANNSPVVIDHPTSRGVPVSAKDPDILNTRGVGFLFRCRAENAQLKGDVFLDPTRAENVTELKTILAQLAAKIPVELSTGFPLRALEVTNGIFEGEEYDYTMRPAGFDHLAIFADKTGACSVSDGCGLGVNEETSMDPKQTTPPVPPASQDSANQRKVMPFLERAKRFLFGDPAGNESDDERRRAIYETLHDTFGLSRDVWIDSVDSEAGTVVFELWDPLGGNGLFRANFSLDENGKAQLSDIIEVRKVITFEPVSNEDAGNSLPTATNEAALSEGSTSQEGNMDRKALIAHLAKVGPLDEAALNKLSDCQLRALHGVKAEPASTNEQTSPEKPAVEVSADVSDLVSTVNALTEQLTSLNGTINELRGEVATLRSAAAPVLAEREAERTRLVERLASNELVPFSREELEQRDFEELRKLDALSRGANYAPMGGPAAGAATNAQEPRFIEPVPYWEQKSEPAKA